MNIPAEFRCEEDGRWVAEIPNFPGVLAYGATRREAAIGLTAVIFRILADRIESGELPVEEEPEAIILGGSTDSLSELLILHETDHVTETDTIAIAEDPQSHCGESLLKVEERLAGPGGAEETDSFAAAQLRPPGTLADYYRLREMLEDLILKVADDESHPMAALVDRVGTLVEQYESTHLPEILESKQKR